jgi:hypothetical protein
MLEIEQIQELFRLMDKNIGSLRLKHMSLFGEKSIPAQNRISR